MGTPVGQIVWLSTYVVLVVEFPVIATRRLGGHWEEDQLS
jgi:hypothetical protein